MYNETSSLAFFRRIINPVGVVLVLAMSMLWHGERFDGYYMVLGIIAFFLSSHLFDDLAIVQPCGGGRFWSGFGGLLFAWALTVGALLFLSYLTHLDYLFDRQTLMRWFLATPLVLVLGNLALRWYVHRIHMEGRARRAIIVGGNEVGTRLHQRLVTNECLLTECLGFFDDRRKDRLPEVAQTRFLGHSNGLAEYVQRERVDIIYIALPISQKDRISNLLSAMKDTTASIYLVPDIFTYDLIQARIDQMGGVPVIAILETPFTSLNAFNKRMEDIILSLLILVLISPIMLVIALWVKLSSPGPIIFKQRRYGLNGDEIMVYKFRSMRCVEDGEQIRQATRDDDRVTPLGRVLRRTSLDELPQFINVLQGRMSIVGPRPHAVAHNEMYRKLIPGYMLRHKVKPGITGWAQVNGLRGETETVDKMAARVHYDLDYMRNWSLTRDLLIIAKTVWLVFKDARAY